MKIKLIFALLLFLLSFLFFNCSVYTGNTPSENPTAESTPIPTNIPGASPMPTEVPGPTPMIVMIDDFNSYDSYIAPPGPPGGTWITGCVTTYIPDPQADDPPEFDNTGVVIEDYVKENEDDKYLTLMRDIFGNPETGGSFTQGYSYAQINFTAKTDGFIKFDYLHKGYVNEPNPTYKLGFWLDPKNITTADISTADWENDEYTDDVFLTYSSAVVKNHQYKLSWKVEKNTDDIEDDIYIDNIRFEYQP
jgi:hypothetical protein